MNENFIVRGGGDYSEKTAEGGFTRVRMRKKWEDDSLPSEFDADKITGTYKGVDRSGFLLFDGLGFGIPRHWYLEKERARRRESGQEGGLGGIGKRY